MYFITLSEMIGTSGQAIARKVAEELNYSFYGEEELLEAAKKMGFPAYNKKFDEKAPLLFERFFTERPKIYLDRMQSVLYEVARGGNAVFFGRGGKFLLQSFDCAFHILVTGSMEKRIQRIMDEMKVGKEVAESMINRSDHDKRAFIRFAYDEDWLNPRLYDLLLNTDKLGLDSAVKMIVDAAKSDGIKSCGIDSVQILGRLSLHRKVESILLEAGMMNPHLFFTVEAPDTVRVYGIANSPAEKKEIGERIKKIQGIRDVKNEMVVLTGSMGGV